MIQDAMPFFSKHLFPEAGYLRLISPAEPSGIIKSVKVPEPIEGIDYISGEKYNRPINLFGEEIPLFATPNIRFPRQPVGLLTGRDRERLEAYAGEIEIGVDGIEQEEASPVYSREISRGSVQDESQKAFQVIEGVFTSKGSSEDLLHPFGSAVKYLPEGPRLEVYIPSQWPGHVCDSISKALGLPKKQIVIHPLNFSVQGPNLEWFPSIIAVYTAIAAMETQGDVLMELSPEELGYWANSSGRGRVSISTGLNKDGKILYLDLSFSYDVGGLAPHAGRIIDREVYNAGGRYFFRHFRIRGEAVTSPWGPREPRLGFAQSPVLFALETHLNRLAEISQQDPGGLKKQLLLKKGKKDIAGVIQDHNLSMESLIDEIYRQSDFERKHGANELLKKRRISLDRELDPLRGIGLSIGMNGNGLFGDREHTKRWKCRVTLESDNKVAIETSGFLGGSGSAVLCKKRVAGILGISPEAVTLVRDPVSADIDSGPSSHGRNASVILDLVEKACVLIQKKRFRSPLPIVVTKSTAPFRGCRCGSGGSSG